MSFEPELARRPVAIGTTVVMLKDAIGHGGPPPELPYQSVHFQIGIIYDDGTTVYRKGDLEPHLAASQKQALVDFMADLRVKAIGEIIG